jgi:hypothetical protein
VPGEPCDRWNWRMIVGSPNGPAGSATRLTGHTLALHMHPDGEGAYPSQATIAAESGLSERSVRTHIRLLERGHWLRIYQKSRPGKAWFVHEYVATIPQHLTGLVKASPWEDDPTWQRAAVTAGRKSAEPVPGDILEQAADAAGRESPESVTLSERPAIPASHPANDDITPGNSCRDARHQLPTNLPSNYLSNYPCNGAPQKRGAPTGSRTARIKHCKTLIQTCPEMSDDAIAKVVELPAMTVLQLRSAL